MGNDCAMNIIRFLISQKNFPLQCLRVFPALPFFNLKSFALLLDLFFIACFFSGCCCSLDTRRDPDSGLIPEKFCKNHCSDWPLWEIDNQGFPLPNGLDKADVDKDGYFDYVTNYETGGQVRIAFHPGLKSVREPWPAIQLGKYPNAESAAFGDLDGDGNIDVAICQGKEFNKTSGVTILWGPSSECARESRAWTQGGSLACFLDGGQFLYIKCRDINDDGAMDIVVGGRGKENTAGLHWAQAPKDPAMRRDLSKWQAYAIDPYVESGHGFFFGDLTGNGFEDIALCNSDWDTPDDKKVIVWYENPGSDMQAMQHPWPKHILYRVPDFYTKEQVVIADLNQDGFNDILAHGEYGIYYFRNNGIQPPDFTLVFIPKPAETCWRARPLRVADMDLDGKLDIIGMLIHKNGYLPRNKAAVFWMKYEGEEPSSDHWTTQVVKWGGGYRGFGKYIGEKWDQMFIEDINNDGFPDIASNVEEYHCWADYVLPFLGICEKNTVYLSVVWFENPLSK